MNHDIILVDEHDNPIGTTTKTLAHQKGQLHRAFSVLIFNDKGQLLIQQRHPDKYHCGGLWTNTCCSHPRPNETTQAAAERRLHEELGFSVPLQPKGHFIYRAEFDNGLTEHELDHVFTGISHQSEFSPNPEEVAALQWIAIPKLQQDMQQNPACYTPWFKQALDIALPVT